MAAVRLDRGGLTTLVLDKGRSVGGRMATRRMDSYRFDHGAQSLNFSDPQVLPFLQRWQQEGIARPCDHSATPDESKSGSGSVSGILGISSFAKSIAADLSIRTGTLVTRLVPQVSGWLVISDDDTRVAARAIILTPPMPQSLDLVHQSDIELPTDMADRLAAIEYDPCIAVMCAYDTSEPIIPSTFVHMVDGPIVVAVDNFAKGVSPRAGAITLLTTPEFSRSHWEVSDSEIVSRILSAAKAVLPANPMSTRVHRWRYSRTAKSHPDTYSLVAMPEIIAFAGDGFGRRDLEGAALSGLAAAGAVLEALRQES